MYWLLVCAALFMFRGQISQRLGPYLPSIPMTMVIFFCNIVSLAGAAVFILPLEFLGLGVVKRMGYLACMWAQVSVSLLSLKENYPPPPIPSNLSFSNMKESMQQLAPYIQPVIHSPDLHFLFLALIFLTASPNHAALIILGRRSFWSVCKKCKKENSQHRIWLMVAPHWAQLEGREKELLVTFALLEILLGLWLAISLALPWRQILTCVLYWQFLKLRYQVPRSREYHGKAWQQLGLKVQPITSRVPILNKPIDMAKAWFQPQVVYQQAQ